jgi:hypothetical protein
VPDLQSRSAGKRPPHRYRLSVPSADEAVSTWMELQDNQSLSIRMLIRDSIERHGYVDIANRPVAQLPAGNGWEAGSASVESAMPAPPKPGPGAADTRQAVVAAPSMPAMEDDSSGGQIDINDIFTQLRR